MAMIPSVDSGTRESRCLPFPKLQALDHILAVIVRVVSELRRRGPVPGNANAEILE